MTDQSPPAAGETSERIEFGSVLPNATGPDVFYDTLDAAIADCAMGPCRIVQRTVTVTPWVQATDPTVPTADEASGCAPDPRCGCRCHRPGAMAVSHVAPCCRPAPPVPDAPEGVLELDHALHETPVAGCPRCAPSGDALDDGPFCQDCGSGQHELVAEWERAAAKKAWREGHAVGWDDCDSATYAPAEPETPNPYVAERGAQ